MRIDVLLEPDQTPAQLSELANLCEQAGIQTMWLQNYFSCRDPFMSLVPAALATSKVGLGVCVISPWEMHPVKMANALLTLHEYSEGRAGLVIGGGGEWVARLGIEVVKRVRAVREAIELIRAGCSGKPLTYQGELFKAYGYRPTVRHGWLTAAGLRGRQSAADAARHGAGRRRRHVQRHDSPAHRARR